MFTMKLTLHVITFTCRVSFMVAQRLHLIKEMGRELGLMSPCEGCTCSFAAELFQGFHKEMKEVLGQSHKLKARVLRLEAELPLVEKELLFETK
jgi:hypothetical protein